MRDALKNLGREALAFARQGQLIVTDAARPRPESAIEGDRVVVFVHGFGAGGAVMRPLRETVERELALPTIDFRYGSHWSFARITEALLARLTPLVTGGRTLDLVGHSLGGIVVRWYVQEQGGAEHVERVVTLATPHAGTRSARIAPGPLRSVLLPNSAVVRRLAAGRGRASRVAHTALVAGRDMMVTPPASAAALSDADVHWFEHLGHNGMLYERDVYGVVLAALS